MCCGRGIKQAATQQYAPLTLAQKEFMTEKEKTNAQYPTYRPVGAFYGNPAPKKSKKPDVVSAVKLEEQQEALDLISKAPIDLTEE